MTENKLLLDARAELVVLKAWFNQTDDDDYTKSGIAKALEKLDQYLDTMREDDTFSVPVGGNHELQFAVSVNNVGTV